MAISTRPTYNYDLSTASGAHDFFVALDGHLTAVGLTQGTTGADYNVAGTSSQMPTVALSTSPWLVYDFTDTANATHPITVWFRMVYGYTTSSDSSVLRYVLQYRVSEGQSSGTALGNDLQCYDGIASPVDSGNSYSTSYTGALGDFVRYDGNSLTVIMGAGGVYSNYNSHRTSLCEMHIERRYTVATGLVGAGFTGFVPPSAVNVSSPPQYATGGYSFPGSANPNAKATPYVSSGAPNVFFASAETRPTTTPLLVAAGAAVVAPVFFMDPAHRPTPAMKMFTVPLASFTQGSVTTMDFSGVSKPYLIYQPYSTNIKSGPLAFAIEWEV